MEIPVIVEPLAGSWRVRCRHPVEVNVTAATRYDALQAAETALSAATGGAVTLLPLKVTPDKPWIAFAGSIPDDETTTAWLAAIEEYRRQRDADDLAPLAPATP